jgi:hypothetical protein
MSRLKRALLGTAAAATAAVLAGTGLVTTAAHADVPAFQTAKNRQVKKFSFDYKRVCPSCQEGEQPRHGIPATATGTAVFRLSTYHIPDDNDRYEFYLVDVTVDLNKRTGDEDWGWMDVRITSVGKTKVVDSSYTTGKGVVNKESCRSYPVNLGVSFFGASAGTTAGHVRFCHQGSQVSQSRIKRGRMYHATGLSGIANLQMQRYVQVPQRADPPRFRVHVTTNDDSLQCPTLSDGTHCFVGHGMHSRGMKIGSSSQG